MNGENESVTYSVAEVVNCISLSLLSFPPPQIRCSGVTPYQSTSAWSELGNRKVGSFTCVYYIDHYIYQCLNCIALGMYFMILPFSISGDKIPLSFAAFFCLFFWVLVCGFCIFSCLNFIFFLNGVFLKQSSSCVHQDAALRQKSSPYFSWFHHNNCGKALINQPRQQEKFVC